jgi:hypothetical protein
VTEGCTSCDSHKNMTQLCNDINSIEMSPNNIHIHRLHNKEAFDLMVIYCDGNGEMYTVCLEFQSPRKIDGKALPNEKQANQYLELRNEFSHQVTNMTKVGKSFANNSIYIFWSLNDFARKREIEHIQYSHSTFTERYLSPVINLFPY